MRSCGNVRNVSNPPSVSFKPEPMLAGAYDDGDLLRANPNHQDWDEEEEAGQSEEEADDAETLTMALGQTSIESTASRS
jgi:hypothetical protein